MHRETVAPVITSARAGSKLQHVQRHTERQMSSMGNIMQRTVLQSDVFCLIASSFQMKVDSESRFPKQRLRGIRVFSVGLKS